MPEAAIFNQTTMGAACEGVAKGAYVLREAEGGQPQLIFIATGSEVSPALEAQQALQGEGTAVRVVSMPSWELFKRQAQVYKEQVLPATVRKRVTIEAGSPLGWREYATDEGTIIAMNRFGESGPGEQLMELFGFSVPNVVEKARAVLRGKPQPVESKEILS